ncbi:MAG: P-loop NTPase [Thaumarchaeota archaeon]|nr:P-loop NTPase [Nitrososphaerota archaeon]
MTEREEVMRALATVKDPELGRDIVSLHMVDDVEVHGTTVTFTLNLTTPACPLRTKLEESARAAVSNLPGVESVEMKTGSKVFATRDYAEAETLKGVKNVIAVASGKGGVGKSTIAVNLAVALAASGAKVGILDADVYGPNVPLMMGLDGGAEVRGEKIIPPEAHGVKVASLGFFYNEANPVIWRGPLVAGAVRQLLTQVDWGELDYLIVDLPPGCVPAGTLVLTANNVPKPIEDLKVGEFVLSYDGEKLVPRRVIGVLPQGPQKVFKLKTPNRTVLASGNHPFLKYHRVNKWTRLDQLKVGDRLIATNCIESGIALPLPDIPHRSQFLTLPKETDDEFMQVAGHYLGEGFIKRQSERREEAVGIRVCEPRGSKFREKYEAMYRRVFGCRTFDDNGGLKFAIASVPLAKFLISLDLDHRAKDKHVPDWVFGTPTTQRVAFLRGYAEADGHVRHRETNKTLPDSRGRYRVVRIVQDTVAIECTNEFLVRQLHELCLMSGLRATNVREFETEVQTLPGGRSIRHSKSFSFEYSLKQDKVPFKLAKVKSIEEVGERETYDLQVDEYQNFVANSLLVHNTGDASLTLAQTVPLGGVLVVTTPQEAALRIAAKALSMFRRLNVPILGVVENMSYFVCPHCGERTQIFSEGGGKTIASEENVDFLGEIPLALAVREQSDLGRPIVSALPSSPEALVFKDLAFRVAGMVSIVAYAKMKK